MVEATKQKNNSASLVRIAQEEI